MRLFPGYLAFLWEAFLDLPNCLLPPFQLGLHSPPLPLGVGHAGVELGFPTGRASL